MPFTTSDFLNVFKEYNLTVWPMQVVLNLSALFIIYLIFFYKGKKDRTINFILGFYWLWMGIVYHLIFFTAINNAAYIFSFLFIVQGALFVTAGGRIKYENLNNTKAIIAFVFFFYALLIYPAIGAMSGHAYPFSPTFGLPCPTTIVTLGILLLTAEKIPLYVFIIPLLWSLMGISAAINFGILEDIGLTAAGAVSVYVVVSERIKKRRLIKV